MTIAERIGAALRFGLCASVGWLFTLTRELIGFGDAFAQTPARLGYLSELALYCSLAWLPLLGIAHLVRELARRRTGHARLVSALGVALGAAWPSILLSVGRNGCGAPHELPLRIGLSVAFIATYVVAWLVHLQLCIEPAPARLERLSTRAQGWLRIAIFGLGVAIGCGFAVLVGGRLQAYDCLVALLMPAVWLAIASALYAAMMRGPDWLTWTTLSVALVFGCAAYGLTAPTPALRAKAELTGRGGLIASSEATRRLASRERP